MEHHNLVYSRTLFSMSLAVPSRVTPFDHQQLSPEVWMRVLSFLGNVDDFNGILQPLQHRSLFVQSLQHILRSTPSLWREIAVRQFDDADGPSIAEDSLQHYLLNVHSFDIAGRQVMAWRAMIADDNRRGAALVRRFEPPLASRFLANLHSYYFCCLVLDMEWDRFSHKIRLHIDARGERDLRHPIGSSLLVLDTSSVRTLDLGGFAGIGQRAYDLASSFFQGFQAQKPSAWIPERGVKGHFKGVLEFSDESLRSSTGRSFEMLFLYANGPGSVLVDYNKVSLCRGTPTENVTRGSAPAIGTATTTVVATQHEQLEGTGPAAADETITWDGYRSRKRSESAFSDDTPDIENHRWRNVAPPEVLNRVTPSPWWV
jgi:hypothetical protein